MTYTVDLEDGVATVKWAPVASADPQAIVLNEGRLHIALRLGSVIVAKNKVPVVTMTEYMAKAVWK